MRVWEIALASVGALALLGGMAVAQAHPLDGLTGAEMSATVEILKADGKIGAAARFPLIELKEPDKAVVLVWQLGQPEPRVVNVNVKDGGKGFKGEVDLAARKVLSWAPAEGEAMLLLEEFLGAMDLALGNPEMKAGLKKRGLTKDQVLCIPLTAGAFGAAGEQGKRLMKVPCLVAPQGSNFYAKPIEGLFAVIDLNVGQVLEVVDTGVRPVPPDEWGYTQAETEARVGNVRPLLNPAALAQPGGVNYKLDGGQVTWDLWRFRLRVDKRPGVVLSLVEANDQGKWRSVLYQAHLSEVFVPYMDPDEGWYWRTYMDSGEYGFGIFLTPLRRGVDCPDYATFLPVTVPQDSGAPAEIPDAVCIFERSVGDPGWRHFEIFAQTPDKPVPAEGRPWTELVVRSASEIGNYDYLMDYVFQQNGMIRVNSPLTKSGLADSLWS